MSEGLNRVMLIGNLGADPDLRVTGAGTAVLNLRVATNESYLDKDQKRQEKTEWHRVTVWGKRAEALGKFLTKGSSLYIEGRLQTTSYEKDGQKRYSTDIVANNVILLGGKRGSGPKESAPSEPDEPEGEGDGTGAGADDIPFISSAGTLPYEQWSFEIRRYYWE